MRIAGDGSDMSKPMTIDYHVAMPDKETAKQLGKKVAGLGYQVEVYASPDCSLPWTTECSLRMIATYDAVIAVQAELA